MPTSLTHPKNLHFFKIAKPLFKTIITIPDNNVFYIVNQTLGNLKYYFNLTKLVR